MARHGENIRKRNDGRWEARYQVFVTEKGRKIYRSVYGSTYDEAKEKKMAAVQRAEKKTGPAAEDRPKDMNEPCIQISFAQAATEWLAEVLGKRRYSTYVKYENIYKMHLDGILGTCLLPGMSGQDIQKKISDHLSGKKLSYSIRKSICCIVNQILAFASEKYSVNVPVLKLPVAKPVKKLMGTFSKAEQSKILACIYNGMDSFKVAMLLCLYTGMRIGELCALQWEDFDFRDRTVTLSRTVQRIAVKGYMTKTILMETEPKSECSRRTIPLSDEIIRVLEKLKKDGSYVFGGEKPLEPRTTQYQFQRFLGEAGVSYKNFHILRHTFATNCVESGMDVKTLSVLLGHSDVKITLNRYVHPTMDSQRRQIGRLSDFYGQIHGQVA